MPTHHLARPTGPMLALAIVAFATGAAGQTGSLTGQVRYLGSGLPVPGVTVRLEGPAPATTTTDPDGRYVFSQLGAGPWRVTPEKMGDALNAVSSFDAVQVLRTVVGLQQLPPQPALACDVTGNGTLSALDASRILQYTVGLITQFDVAGRCTSDWVFFPVPAGGAAQPTPPRPAPTPCIPGSLSYASVSGSIANQDFEAALFGDCTGNWAGVPTATPTPTATATPTATVTSTPLGAPWPQLGLGTAYTGLARPIYATNAGDGSGRLFIVLQGGTVRLVKNGTLLTTPFLDITTRVSCCGERGLLSMAFPRSYATKGFFYVYYTDTAGNLVIARYRTSANADVADPASEQIVLTIPHPSYTNHNGGQLQFGPDGYLYAGTGDGGGGGDPANNGQNYASLLGKLLRLDVDSVVPTGTPTGTPTPYLVPPSNPTPNGTPGYRSEIWAAGLRNPWRFSFDRLTGDLYIGDVGQGAWEEIDVQPVTSTGGENYGWRIMEGTHCYNPPTCSSAGLVLPVWEYPHAAGDCSVTGGFVYRGTAYPCLHGVYVYADYCTGRIWGLKQVGGTWVNTQLYDAPFNITSFGEDEAGNLWVADSTNSALRLLTDACVGPTLTPTATRTPTP